MKKLFLGFMCLAALANFGDAAAAEQARWGLFGLASDVDGADTGVGGGAFGELEVAENVYMTGDAFLATYDDSDRAQVLVGGEWRDRGPRAIGYIGLQVGADLFDTDTGSEEDAFARLYYDIGWRLSKRSELRFGVAYDGATDLIEREVGVRLGWTTAEDDGFGFFVRGEAYSDETNVFAGVSWAL